MSILITGANGFLGYYLAQELLEKDQQVIGTGKGDCRSPFLSNSQYNFASLDITSLAVMAAVFEKYQPALIVHAAAMSKPDDCEIQQDLAYAVNVEGTINLLREAEKQKAFFVFISTDFVFDGEKAGLNDAVGQGMYSEEDIAAPVNYYGYTKLMAEQAVQQYKHGWAIIRTSLVYGKPLTGKQNILTIVKDKLEKGEGYQVVDDQVRTPTYVEDLAAGIRAVIEKRATGIFHIAGKDVLTPYRMACKTAAWLDRDVSLIKRTTVAGFSQPARRPANTPFIIDKAKKELGYDPISFEEGLRKTFPAQK